MTTPTVTPGAYEVDGSIYVVKYNNDKTRTYAKRLVEKPSPRITLDGSTVDFDFEYERGAIYRIRPEHQIPASRAKAIMIRYGRCIICGRALSAKKSVERGIGPVCIKAFKATE